MKVIEDAAVWLQTYIDGNHGENFLRVIAPFKEGISNMDVDNQKLWLVDFWISQLTSCGVFVTATTKHYYQEVILVHGVDGFMPLVKTPIETHNLPRV